MKLIPALALTTALLAHGTAVFAQGPRPPVPPVPPVPPGSVTPPRPPLPPAPPSAPREPVTFLGLVATPASQVLTEQLGLPPGFGLVVESVVPDSPAAAAGVQPYDLLQMLNDQKLVGPEQLASLVRSLPEGATVSLTLLRKGQEQKLTAKLARRAPEAAPRRGPREGRFWTDFLPRDFLGGAEGGQGRNRVILRRGEDRGAHGTAMGLGDAHLILKDEAGEVEVVTKAGKREVTARRPDGSVIYSGPVETDEDRRKLPEDALKKLDRLNGLNGGRRGAPTPPAGDADNDEDTDFIFEDGFTQPVPPPPRPADAAHS